MRQPKRAERKPSQRLSKAIRKELAEKADADWKAAEWAAYSKKVVNNASAQAARAVRAMRELEASKAEIKAKDKELKKAKKAKPATSARDAEVAALKEQLDQLAQQKQQADAEKEAAAALAAQRGQQLVAVAKLPPPTPPGATPGGRRPRGHAAVTASVLRQPLQRTGPVSPAPLPPSEDPPPLWQEIEYDELKKLSGGELGAGSYGEVVKVYYDGKVVAVKKLKEVTKPSRLERHIKAAYTEADVLAQLNHPCTSSFGERWSSAEAKAVFG